MTGTQALLISGQISLPVSVSAVAAAAGIKVIDYATFRAQFENSLDDICRMVSYAGFSMLADGRMVAVLNSQLCYAPRRKWTAAHEVGHLLSGHITDPPTLLTQQQEREADDFAAELLAPLTVLHFCGVSSATEIEKLCGISRQAAEFRFQELSRLRRAGRGIPARSQERAVLTGLHFPENRRTARTLLKIRAVHRELYSIKIPPRRL